MNRFALGLLASAVVAVALPAAAQSYSAPGYGPTAAPSYGQGGYGQGGYGQSGYVQLDYDQPGYGRDGYGRDGRGDFHAQIERLSDRVRRDIDEGDLNAWQGRRLMAQIGDLRQLERRYRYSGGYLDGRERMDLQARLEQLKDAVRRAHGPRGYDRDDGYDRDGYSQPGYSQGYGDQGYDDEGYWNTDRGDRGPRR